MLPFPIISIRNILPTPIKILQLRSSAVHMGVLYDTGELFLRGDGANYKLGTGSTASSTTWYLSLTNVKFFAISTAGTLAIKNDNTVWYCGLSRLVTGVSGTTTTNTWTDITSTFGSLDVSSIVDIRMTNSCILYLVDSFLFGQGYNGGYELGSIGTNISTPTLIASDVKKILCSRNQSGYISTSGIYYRSGTNNAYQLGTGNTTALQAFTAWNSTGEVLDAVLTYNQGYLLYKATPTSVVQYYTAGQGYTGGNGINANSTYVRYTTNSALDNRLGSFLAEGSSLGNGMIGLGLTSGLYSTGENGNGQIGSGTATASVFPFGLYSEKFSTTAISDIQALVQVHNLNGSAAAMNFVLSRNRVYYSGKSTVLGIATSNNVYEELTDMPYYNTGG